jgi:hypothetical protein
MFKMRRLILLIVAGAIILACTNTVTEPVIPEIEIAAESLEDGFVFTIIQTPADELHYRIYGLEPQHVRGLWFEYNSSPGERIGYASYRAVILGKQTNRVDVECVAWGRSALPKVRRWTW